MASAYAGLPPGASDGSPFSLAALSRWSSLKKPLPAIGSVKALHVYDFDNTLFKSPLPNPALWNGQTIGMLSSQDVFVNGGWWHDSRILAATGRGLAEEELRAWDGWWNDKVVQLVRLSIRQPDALCVLLTGRSEKAFAELVKKIVASKGLDFDMMSLKPVVSPTNQSFQNTMHFKQLFLNALMETYKEATEIRVYEDRPKHSKGFREFFAEYNRRQALSPTRGRLTAEVVQVAESAATLDPVVEVSQVQQMINLHNETLAAQPSRRRHGRLRIKKTVFFTSYMIGPQDSAKLLKLAQIPPTVSTHDLKFHANNILICPRPCPATILDKVGGMGSKMLWEVTGTACLDNSIWAARVRPVPSTAVYHTDNPVPLVVVALRKGSRPVDAGKINTWQPLSPDDGSVVFETTVGEKVILRIEAEDPREDEYESLFANKSSKKRHAASDDWIARTAHAHAAAARHEPRGYSSATGRGAAAAGRPRAGSGTAPGAGAGRGSRSGGRGLSRAGRAGRSRGGHNYRSLDDVEPKGHQAGYGIPVDYGDGHPPPTTQALVPPTGPRGSRTWSQRGRGSGQLPPRPAAAFAAADLQNYY